MDTSLHMHYQCVVDALQAPLRIDKFLHMKLSNVSRHKIQQSIKQGFVHANQHCPLPSYKVQPADHIRLYLPTPPVHTSALPEPIHVPIHYEDKDVLIVQKPSGLVVHPAHANWTGTLLNGLLYHLKEQKDAYPFLVHRLDKDTSGLLIVAKKEEAMGSLAQQFFSHSIEREYWALVWGHPTPTSGTIHLPLCRHPKDRRIVCVSEDLTKGKDAITHYSTLRTYKHVSLLCCKLETGRTHQIRAHLKHIGHPIFNDYTYGGDKPCKGVLTTSYKHFLHNCWELLPHQALHAKSLGFIHPATQQRMVFTSQLPTHFQAVLDKWQQYSSHAMPSEG